MTKFLNRGAKPWGESLLLIVPWAGAAAATGLFVLGRHSGSRFNGHFQLIELVTGLLFLDSVHITFTFALVAGLTELKDWAVSRDFWWKTAAAGVILAFVFYFIRFSASAHTSLWLTSTFLLLEAAGPSQHTLAQMRGISFCYHSQIRKSGILTLSQMEIANTVEKTEKMLFRLLFFGDIVSVAPYFAGKLLPHNGYLQTCRVFGMTLVVVSAAAILANGAVFPESRRTNKMYYLTRVLLYPLRLFIGPVGLVVRACHGTEYWVVVKRMSDHSKSSPARRKKFLYATCAIALCYAPIFIFTYRGIVRGWGFAATPVVFFQAALVIHTIVRYLHFYMDSRLYRMADPSTRAAVAPLLVPPVALQAQKAA